jgi:hypothetical protein
MTTLLQVSALPTCEPVLAEIRRLIDTREPDLASIGRCLRSLAREPLLQELIDDRRRAPAGGDVVELGRVAPELPLTLTRCPAGSELPERKALVWGVTCVARGRIRLSTWRRTFPEGELRRIESLTLSAANFFVFQGEQRDLHSRMAIDGPAWELNLHRQR